MTLNHGEWRLDVLPPLDAFDERDDNLLEPRSRDRLGYTRVISQRVSIIDNAVHRFLFEPSWHDSFPSQPEMTCFVRRSSRGAVHLLLRHYGHSRSVRTSFPFHIFPLDFLRDMIRPLNPVCQAVGSTARRRETTLGLHSWKDTSTPFILDLCPTVEGEYALSAAGVVSPGEDQR